MLIIAVNCLNPEHGAGYRGGGVRSVYFSDGELGLLEVIKNQLTVVARAQPDGLGRLCCHYIGVRYGDLSHFITINRETSQGGCPIRPGGHVCVVAMVDALHLEHRAGNHFPGLPVPLEDGKIGELVVHRGDGDRAAAVNIRLIHMDDHRLRQPGKRRRDRDLYEGIQALSDAGDGDDAGGVRGLRSDDLAVLQDIEDSTLDGAGPNRPPSAVRS